MTTFRTMITGVVAYLLAGVAFLYSLNAEASEPLRIYIDADFSNHAESSISIERGLEIALQRRRSQMQGRTVRLIRKNHRGNSRRSKSHIQQYLQDSNAIAMVSGIHSPPLLANQALINNKEVLFLVPWAAAGPITRAKGKENWIFRLSIDDRKAGAFISQHVVQTLGFQKPRLVLEKTGWGQSNFETISSSLARRGIQKVDVTWFDWGLGASGAAEIVEDSIAQDNDSIILVSNAVEGALIANTFAQTPRMYGLIPIVSHWGITGGDFQKKVPHSVRDSLAIQFLQTRFSFLSRDLNSFQRGVLSDAIDRYHDLRYAEDLKAPSGFIHAFDLANVFLTALESTRLSGDIVDDRRRVRHALETMETPVVGLLKTYQQPFSTYSINKPDAHEALTSKDFAMGYFGSDDAIRLLSNPVEMK